MTEHLKTESQSYTIPCIGMVRSKLTGVMGNPDYGVPSMIEVDSCWANGLTGIEQFSHLWVIYYQHERLEWMQQRNWGSPMRTIVPDPDPRAGNGIFTIRAPCRPAGLGSCIVRLLRREQQTLVVEGLDAINGTPVMDIKVYIPKFDAVPDAETPENWITGMQKRYQQENRS